MIALHVAIKEKKIAEGYKASANPRLQLAGTNIRDCVDVQR